jgi:hypothetical protein
MKHTEIVGFPAKLSLETRQRLKMHSATGATSMQNLVSTAVVTYLDAIEETVLRQAKAEAKK